MLNSYTCTGMIFNFLKSSGWLDQNFGKSGATYLEAKESDSLEISAPAATVAAGGKKPHH